MNPNEGTPTVRTILVVDDDAIFREGASSVLCREGFHVVPAANGAEALKLLHNGVRPDLILMEMLLPVLDGWSLLQEKKSNPAMVRTPVVIVTGIRVANPDWAAFLGAKGYLRKPVTIEALVLELKRVLHLA